MKNIWIFNHYATSMFKDKGGRHYWFAENLINKGYDVTIFCASTIHNSSNNIEIGKGKYILNSANGIKFIFVKTPNYIGNGIKRISNMIAFYINLFPISKKYAELKGKPDIILASSVHPLTLVAGIKISKKFRIPCICEVRDLWPESIIAYGILKRNSCISKILYKGEKWIYKKADSIIMTWEGGREYIINKGWEKEIKLEKVKYISNGVMIKSFDKNCLENQVNDSDLDNTEYKNVIYAGSIRKVNNLSLLLDAAKLIQDRGIKKIKFLIYGDGDESEMLKSRCKEEKIDNVIFKGRVDKKYIPYILKKAYVNILHNSSTSLDKYGQSQNKFFEYLAAGKCIVQTYVTGYNICEKFGCGICVSKQTAEAIADAVIIACSDDYKNKLIGENAREAAYQFDFEKLTNELINVIETL